MNANSLAYLPGLGTYQMSAIHQKVATKGSNEEQYELVQAADPSQQDTLDTEAVFDEMNAEQTWPTEQELAEAQVKPVKKRVPKGTSEYQAAWILDSEDEELTDDEERAEGSEEDDEQDEDEDEDEVEGSECSDDMEEDEEEMETVSRLEWDRMNGPAPFRFLIECFLFQPWTDDYRREQQRGKIRRQHRRRGGETDVSTQG